MLKPVNETVDIQAEYKKKLVSAEEAVKVVKSGDWIDYSHNIGQPIALDKALAARCDEADLTGLKFRSCMRLYDLKVMKSKNAKTFAWNSWHQAVTDRKLNDAGLGYYIPIRLSEGTRYYRENNEVDVVMFRVSPMDEHGWFGLGPNMTWLMGVLDKATTIIFEVNKNVPRVLGGYDDKLHISQIDYVVESDNEPMPVLPNAPSSEVDRKVAKLIVEEIPNGACLQLGIGGMPNAVGELIAESDLKDLGVHTEMYVDGLYKLAMAGKVTGLKKNIDRGLQVYCFATGSEALYRYIDNNPGLKAVPDGYSNEPRVIAQLDNFISINSCVNVDLYGQISSESQGFRQISGTGGQLDFVLGAYMSKGGKSFICMPSTYKDEKGERQSRIVPFMEPGTVITCPRTTTHWVVTEHGKVNLKGKTTWERAELLISIADPKFQDVLIKQAEHQGIWYKSSKLL